MSYKTITADTTYCSLNIYINFNFSASILFLSDTETICLCLQAVAQVWGHPKNIVIISQQILGEGGKWQYKQIGIIPPSPEIPQYFKENNKT